VLCAVDQHAQRIGAIRTDTGKRANLTGAGCEVAAADQEVDPAAAGKDDLPSGAGVSPA